MGGIQAGQATPLWVDLFVPYERFLGGGQIQVGRSVRSGGCVFYQYMAHILWPEQPHPWNRHWCREVLYINMQKQYNISIVIHKHNTIERTNILSYYHMLNCRNNRATVINEHNWKDIFCALCDKTLSDKKMYNNYKCH